MAGFEPWRFFILFLFFSCRDVYFVAFLKFKNDAGISKHIKIKNSIYFGFLLNTDRSIIQNWRDSSILLRG